MNVLHYCNLQSVQSFATEDFLPCLRLSVSGAICDPRLSGKTPGVGALNELNGLNFIVKASKGDARILAMEPAVGTRATFSAWRPSPYSGC